MSETRPYRHSHPRWRHKKRGTVYVEIGRGCLQTARDEFLDQQQVVIYQAETGGQTWVRPTYEFMDGRFERVSPDGLADRQCLTRRAC